MAIKFDSDLVGQWVSQYTESTIRKILTVSPKQAAAIKAGDYSGFETLLMWAATSQDQVIVDELAVIEEFAGIQKSHASVLLGMWGDQYRRARKGEPVPFYLAVYIRQLAKNKRLLTALINRKL